MPRIADSTTDVWNLRLAAKYLDKSFNIFDEKALGRPASSALEDWVGTEVERHLKSEE
jgi:hypothetical protein